MPHGSPSIFAPFAEVIALFLLIFAVLWFLLPFAVFGVKARIDKAVSEVQRVNAQLEALIREVQALRDEQPSRVLGYQSARGLIALAFSDCSSLASQARSSAFVITASTIPRRAASSAE